MYALIKQLCEPYTLLVVASALAVAAMWRCQRPRGRLLQAAALLLALLCLLSLPLTGYLAMGSLEWWYPPATDAPDSYDTLIVLGGDYYVEADGIHARLGKSSMQRCYYAAQLYKQAGGCRVVLCGGKVDPADPGPTLASTMREFMLELGVQADDLLLEDRSATTYENALFATDILKAEGLLGPDRGRVWLATEASHLFRGERCFRALGVGVICAPCDQHAGRWEFRSTTLVPSASGIVNVNRAAYEWAGVVWYLARGRI